MLTKDHLLAACAVFAITAPSGLANEVYLNTMSSKNGEVQSQSTEVVERQHGPYVGVWLGISTNGDASLRGPLVGSGLEDSTGFAGGLKLGYYFRTPYALRPAIELELGYLSNNLNHSGTVENGKSETAAITGGSNFQAFTGMINLVVALDLGAYRQELGDFAAAIHPYIGVGGGAAYSKTSDFNTRIDGKEVKLDSGSKVGFAYQLITGLEFDLAEDFSIFGEYKRVAISNTGSENIKDYERNLWVFGCKLAY